MERPLETTNFNNKFISFIGFSAKKVALFKTDTALIGFMAILTAFEIIPIVSSSSKVTPLNYLFEKEIQFDSQAIPLQSSMKGNHENFNKYIRIIVSVYACLLVPYGIFGYIRYGEGVQQLLSLNLPADPVLIVINCLLLLVGLFAYPMCMNPVIEFFEVRLFAEGEIVPDYNVKPCVASVFIPETVSSVFQVLSDNFDYLLQ